MIVTSIDGQNIVVAIDLAQAKHIVELLRHASDESIDDASTACAARSIGTGDGVETMAALHSFIAVVGRFTDQVGTPAPPPPLKVLPVNPTIN